MMFPTLWRKWIKECINMTTTSVLVNGSPATEFPLESGLRQGDTLSAIYFFRLLKDFMLRWRRWLIMAFSLGTRLVMM